jgi:hypothetical protein
MRARPHQHPCHRCQALVECRGEIQENFDGWPESICLDYHGPLGSINADFMCEECAELEDEDEA